MRLGPKVDLSEVVLTLSKCVHQLSMCEQNLYQLGISFVETQISDQSVSPFGPWQNWNRNGKQPLSRSLPPQHGSVMFCLCAAIDFPERRATLVSGVRI